MDDSMSSVHSVSAMDISPASSPINAIHPIPSNYALLKKFQQQHELLMNTSLNKLPLNDDRSVNKNPTSCEFDDNSESCLFSTVLAENNVESRSPIIHTNDPYQLRSRKFQKSASLCYDSGSKIENSVVNSSRQSFTKIFLFILITTLIIFFIVQHVNMFVKLSRSTSWQNASEYLTKNLIGQEEGLEQFKDAMKEHNTFTVILIEGPIGSGKSYLASSLEKFIPTTLISTNNLLGLSKHHWTDPDRLLSYLLSHLTPSKFQFLIIDDLDLLPSDVTYCETLATSFALINNNKNLFILLLQTGSMRKTCKEKFDSIIKKYIKFTMLQRHHIRRCVENEAYIQNVQPPFDNQQIENILNSLAYTNEKGILYSTTGCKQIPSLVMLESKNSVHS